jgi:hypothetical protein
MSTTPKTAAPLQLILEAELAAGNEVKEVSSWDFSFNELEIHNNHHPSWRFEKIA